MATNNAFRRYGVNRARHRTELAGIAAGGSGMMVYGLHHGTARRGSDHTAIESDPIAKGELECTSDTHGALGILRERYANGEIDEEEKVEA